MFLTDAQAALNDLIVEASETLDHYQQAQSLTDTPQLIALFKKIQADRRPLLQHLQEAARHNMHMLPRAPDQEREELASLMTRLHASLEGHRDLVLCQDRLDAEARLKQLIHTATEHPLPTPVQMRLYELAGQVAEAEGQLESLKEALQQAATPSSH